MKAIKTLREQKGMTQQGLAEAMGTSQSAVALWETGDRQPRADKLPKLAAVLGCDIADLYGDTAKATA